MTFRFFHRFSGARRAAMQHARKGTTATEMALLTPVFFLLLIGITETCLVLTAQQLLENAAFNAARLAKTGYVSGVYTQGQTVAQLVSNELGSFGALIDTSKITTTSTAYNDFADVGAAGKGTAGLGKAQQIIVYTITYPWKLFTPLMGNVIGTWDAGSNSWVVNLTSRIVVRNEPYS